MRNYRFEYRIFDEATDDTIVRGSTFINPPSVDEFGGCESVDIEVSSGLRFFRQKGRELFESKVDEKEFDEIWP